MMTPDYFAVPQALIHQPIIQWFPGHMHKARKAFQERLPDTDIIIEVVDARLPRSSSNPMLEALVLGRKPLIKILNKQDLADKNCTQRWLNWFQQHAQTRAIAIDQHHTHPSRILTFARELAPHRSSSDKPLRLMICGIPNVGKSTLINTLAGRKIAKTGNEPAITKSEQRIDLDHDIILFDTPGMLWPKIEHEFCGNMLAASGAIGRNAYDEETVSDALLHVLAIRYPDALKTRYKLTNLSAHDITQLDRYELFLLLGKKMGMVRTGGHIDTQKTAERLLTDFREGRIGSLSVETPDDWQRIETDITAAREATADKLTQRAHKKSRRLASLEDQTDDSTHSKE